MTAFDNFIEEVNNNLFVHCLGEKISLKTENNRTLTGDFLSINPDNLNNLLIHDDETCFKQKIDMSKNMSQRQNLINMNKSSSVKRENSDDFYKDEIMYFKIDNICLTNIKSSTGKIFIAFNF